MTSMVSQPWLVRRISGCVLGNRVGRWDLEPQNLYLQRVLSDSEEQSLLGTLEEMLSKILQRAPGFSDNKVSLSTCCTIQSRGDGSPHGEPMRDSVCTPGSSRHGWARGMYHVWEWAPGLGLFLSLVLPVEPVYWACLGSVGPQPWLWLSAALSLRAQGFLPLCCGLEHPTHLPQDSRAHQESHKPAVHSGGWHPSRELWNYSALCLQLSPSHRKSWF